MDWISIADKTSDLLFLSEFYLAHMAQFFIRAIVLWQSSERQARSHCWITSHGPIFYRTKSQRTQTNFQPDKKSVGVRWALGGICIILKHLYLNDYVEFDSKISYIMFLHN